MVQVWNLFPKRSDSNNKTNHIFRNMLGNLNDKTTSLEMFCEYEVSFNVCNRKNYGLK